MAYSEGYRGFHLRFSPRVVVSLTWGQVSLWIIAVQVFQEGRYRCSPEIPGLTVDPGELCSAPAKHS